jgi:hypothetical protein
MIRSPAALSVALALVSCAPDLESERPDSGFFPDAGSQDAGSLEDAGQVCPEPEGATGCSFAALQCDAARSELGERIGAKIRELNGPCVEDSECLSLTGEDITCAATGIVLGGPCVLDILKSNLCEWRLFAANIADEACVECQGFGCASDSVPAGCADNVPSCIGGVCR